MKYLIILFSAFLSIQSYFETAHAELLTELRLANESFLNREFAETQQTNFQYLGLHFFNSSKVDSLQADVTGYLAPGAMNMSTLAVNELYFQTDAFQIGRQKYLWSLMEERWHNGIIEPVNRSRPLNPKQQGLTGFFWQKYFEHSTINVILSPIFIPEFGPAYEIDNGEFTSSDPWFQRPPSYVQIFPDQEAEPIEYRILKPSESKVVLQKTFGVQFHGKQESRYTDHFYWSFAHFYKPNNQFAMAYDGFKSADNLEKNQIEIEPHVFYHNVTSADLSYRHKRHRVGISGIYDVPENNIRTSGERSWTTPLYSPAFVFSPFVELDLRYFSFSFSRLETFGGEVKEQGDLASDERSSISAKYPMRTANQVSLTSFTRINSTMKLMQTLDYVFGDRGEFEVIRWAPQIQLSSIWHLYAELELISGVEPSVRSPNIYYNYVDHDRLHLGVGYVF